MNTATGGSFSAQVERNATHARALGMYESAEVRVGACARGMPIAENIRGDSLRGGKDQRGNPGSMLPTAERMREFVEMFKLAIVALEEAAVAAEVYQEADAALRLGAGKAG